MLVRTARGHSHSLGDYDTMLTEAGFGALEQHDLPGLSTRVLVATKIS